MELKELLCLELGEYELVDNIYVYKLNVGLNDDGSKHYVICVKGELFGSKIFMSEEIDESSGDKILSSHISVGTLSVHSYDIHSILHKLKLFNV